MKKTAMQQAIKEIAELWSSPSDTPTYTQIFNVLENKLEIEKQQIIEAYNKGCNEIHLYYEFIKDENITQTKEPFSAEEYYNETFNK